MQFSSDLELWKLILGVVQVIGLAAIAAWAKVQKDRLDHKTSRWEQMTQRAIDASESAAGMIEENTRITKSIQKQTDGVNSKLANMAVSSTYAAGILQQKLRSVADEHGHISTDDLDRIEEEFLKKPLKDDIHR